MAGNNSDSRFHGGRSPTAIWACDELENANELLLLLAIASQQDFTKDLLREKWLADTWLMAHCRMSKPRLYRTRTRLAKAGLLTFRKSSDGKTHYQLSDKLFTAFEANKKLYGSLSGMPFFTALKAKVKDSKRGNKSLPQKSKKGNTALPPNDLPTNSAQTDNPREQLEVGNKTLPPDNVVNLLGGGNKLEPKGLQNVTQGVTKCNTTYLKDIPNLHTCVVRDCSEPPENGVIRKLKFGDTYLPDPIDKFWKKQSQDYPNVTQEHLVFAMHWLLCLQTTQRKNGIPSQLYKTNFAKSADQVRLLLEQGSSHRNWLGRVACWFFLAQIRGEWLLVNSLKGFRENYGKLVIATMQERDFNKEFPTEDTEERRTALAGLLRQRRAPTKDWHQKTI